MEDNHYVIKDIHPSNQLIEKVPMIRNHFFPLNIAPKNTKFSFKAESKEEVVHCDKKENDSVEIQAVFQPKVQDES